MQDKQLQCCDCRSSFVFTARDQEYFQLKGFSEPKRCKPCRAKKKARAAQFAQKGGAH